MVNKMTNIDFHVHITPPDIIADWEKYAKKEAYFSLLSRSKENKFAAAEDVVSVLENEGTFDKAVVFGFAFRDIGLCRYVNDYVIEKVKEFPEKLIGFMVVPSGGRETTKEIERCFGFGLRGVGELFPEGQRLDLKNPKKTRSITGPCKELGLSLLLHANEPVGHYYPGKTGVSLKHLETFIANNPGLKIVLAHFGGGIFVYEAMKEISETFRDVYYDTAAAPFLYDFRIYRAAKALGLTEKILFGSDFPLLSPSRYMPALEESGLSVEEKRLILGENARKLLGI
jgi:predicted TIM-barrel fold metal-dependent hydrolase